MVELDAHFPLAHLNGESYAHPLSLSHNSGLDTQNPSLHLWLK